MNNDFLSLDDEKVRNADRHLAILEEWLAAMESIESTPSLRNGLWVSTSLLRSSRCAYHHLRAGWQVNSSCVAWGCRNLLELSIFAKYVVRSPLNLNRFIDDAKVDSCQSADALLRLAQNTGPASTFPDEAEQALVVKIDALRSKSGFNGSDYLRATRLARDMNMDDKIHDIYKICSKLIHPTAQSILLIHMEDQHERDALFVCGANYLIDLMNDMFPFMELLQQESCQS
jgi:hypothetical protein